MKTTELLYPESVPILSKMLYSLKSSLLLICIVFIVSCDQFMC